MYRPCCSAAMLRIISTTLPKVALSSLRQAGTGSKSSQQTSYGWARPNHQQHIRPPVQPLLPRVLSAPLHKAATEGYKPADKLQPTQHAQAAVLAIKRLLCLQTSACHCCCCWHAPGHCCAVSQSQRSCQSPPLPGHPPAYCVSKAHCQVLCHVSQQQRQRDQRQEVLIRQQQQQMRRQSAGC